MTDLTKMLQENKDAPEVVAFLKENTKAVDLDAVKGFITDTDEGKAYLTSTTDSLISKAVNNYEIKFKAEKLQALVDAKHQELFPDESAETKQNRELMQRLEKLEKSENNARVTTKAIKYAADNEIPSSFVDHFISDTEETTISNLKIFKEKYDTSVAEAMEQKTGNFTRKSPKPGGKHDEVVTMHELINMTDAQREKIPMEEQIRIQKDYEKNN